jgi:hypothetical protein
MARTQTAATRKTLEDWPCPPPCLLRVATAYRSTGRSHRAMKLQEHDLKIELSEVTHRESGWEQKLTYRKDGRIRNEIFCGRTSKELGTAIHERVRELRKSAAEI